MKRSVAAPALLVLSRVLFMIERKHVRSDRGGEECGQLATLNIGMIVFE